MEKTQSGWIRRAGWLGILVTLMLVLTACSITGKRIKAYDGPELSETATLEAPENIKVISINGQAMTSFLLDDLSLSYSLKPGSNQIVFQYRSIWSKAGVRGNDERAVDVIESDRIEANFNARPGETYTFAVDDVGSLREARRLASGFSAPIVDSSGEIVARPTPYTGQERGAVAAPSQPNAGPPEPAAPEPAASTDAAPDATGNRITPDDMSTLDALNLLWEQASPKEKEAFLRQAFE